MGTLDHAFFYNSKNNDRVYDAESFEYWLKKFFTTGVFTGDLQVTANDNMTVTVSAGYANINGKVKYLENAVTLTLESANDTYGRIDDIVLERNDTDRDITAKVVTGGYSSSPSATAPVRANGVYQIVLAHVSVTTGATKITQSMITDTRSDTDLCGIITSTVTNMDFSQFAAQFTAYYNDFKTGNQTDFNSWFQSMKDQLSTDAAGHLQLEIDNNATAISDETTRAKAAEKTNADNITTLNSNITYTVTSSGAVTVSDMTKYKYLLAIPIYNSYLLNPCTVPIDKFMLGQYAMIVDYNDGTNRSVTVFYTSATSLNVTLTNISGVFIVLHN